MQTVSDKFNEVDYFTQRQIINEFPSIFPEHHGIKESNYSPIIENDGTNFADMGIVIFFVLGAIALVMRVIS